MSIDVWKIASRWSETGTPESSVLQLFYETNIAFVYIDNANDITKMLLTGGKALLAIADGHTIDAIAEVIKFGKVKDLSADPRLSEYADISGFLIKIMRLSPSEKFQFAQPKRFAHIDDEYVSAKVKQLYYKRQTDYVLSLKEIASWNNLSFKDINPPIVASIPALQRGLVWKPKQIELLWDSIMRGIPIGSFVVCSKIESQQRHDDKKITHHLLDGQQRCNAITLGFTPFPEKICSDSIIWIDLNPKIPSSSTRNFLIRLTTQAHPWGYTESDSEGRLSTGHIRDCLRENLDINEISTSYRRPAPNQLRPYKAQLPVPLSILLNSDIRTAETFWQEVVSALDNATETWSTAAKTFINSVDSNKQKEKIFNGVKTALAARIIALKAPDELVEESEQEKNNSSQTENISNIEHLFQRLNQQGTRLEGEELTYSMIKAYWPQLAGPIDDIARGRMPASRMVSLAVRIALSDEQLHHAISVSNIRRIAKEDGALRGKILDFIGTSITDSPLQNACLCVDKWMGLEDNCIAEWGVLKVHRTSIAIDSPDVYLLLLWLAYKYPDISQKMYHYLTGMATILHWHGKDNSELCNIILKKCKQNELSLAAIVDALREGKDCLRTIYSPDEISNSIKIPATVDEKSLDSWTWWNCFMVEGFSEEEQRERENNWWPFICNIKGNKELLLYAQRKFLAKRFPDYDPARKDLWESHNRPWDYDHILPYYYTYCQRGILKDFCCQWIDTIANLRAWPFEDNRSDQKDTAKQKMRETESWENSFIDQIEQDGFDHSADVIKNPKSSYSFAISCKSRLVRIYREWYENLKIGELIHD